MLSLRDPADETNDLGRKGIAIKHVQATFGSLIHKLEVDMKVNTCHSLLAPLVGPSYAHNFARRAKLHNYGVRLMDQMKGSLAAKSQAIRDAEDTGKAETDVEKEIKEET